MWKCPKCETINDADTCTVCGEKQPVYSSNNQMPVYNNQTPVYDSEKTVAFGAAPVMPTMPTMPGRAAVPKAAGGKKSNTVVVLLSLILIVLVAFLAAALVIIYRSNEDDYEDDSDDKKTVKIKTKTDEEKKESDYEHEYYGYGEPEEKEAEAKEEEVKAEEAKAESTYVTYKQDITWEEAKVKAENMGGHLACINSEEEFDELCQMADAAGIRVLWIGARKYGEYWTNARWVDGEQMTYTKWLPGEPTNYDEYGNSENYLVILKRNGEWYFNDEINDIAVYSFVAGQLGYAVEFE